MALHLADDFGQIGVLQQPASVSVRPAIVRRLFDRGFVETTRYDEVLSWLAKVSLPMSRAQALPCAPQAEGGDRAAHTSRDGDDLLVAALAFHAQGLHSARSGAPSDARPPSAMPLWCQELVGSLQFQVLVKYRFARSSHMNVNEHLVFRTLAKIVAKAHPGSRIVFFGDSMVSGAVAAKGRSSSNALNRLQTATLPYVLGSGVSLAPLRVSSALNPSDDPTRDREVRGPCRLPSSWWKPLSEGDPRAFDAATRADFLRKPLAAW